MITRRNILAAAAAGACPASALAGDRPERRLADLEARHGGRLGVAILDTASGRLVSHRGAERFPMCSTFKAALAGCVLARVDRGDERPDRIIPYGRKDLQSYGPVTQEHVDEGGLTVAQLCAAAVTVSDNTAANLLLASIGGPAALTAWLRSIGDQTTRLDRTEPELNTAIPGDPRDTTTPQAMTRTLQTLVLGQALSARSRRRLADWLLGCRTGASRLKAGLPADWRIGDKTGTGRNGATNDIGVIWPPGRAPLVTVAYYAWSKAPDAEREAVLAEVGRIVAGL